MPDIRLEPVQAEDIDLLHDLVRRAEVADRVPLVTARSEVEEWRAGAHVDAGLDLRIALLGGEPAGWARVDHVPSGTGLERAYVFGAVVPELRRRGVGTELLDWGTERARELLAAHEHDLPRFVRVHQYDWIDDAHALYRAGGFTPVRWFEDLLRPLDELPEPTVPEGLRIEPWDVARGEEARLVKNAAFADHWGSTPSSVESWGEWLGGHGARPDLSLMAFAGDELVGVSVNEHYPDDEELLGRRDGWIQSLGVLGTWRGRGVASALIAHSLHAFARAGFTHAALGVDTDNPTGAAGLYRRLGFQPMHRAVTSQIEVTPSPR
ncbi:MAG: GNAT family N-acetyltransferase [Acidimicrobiia bacterium]